MESSASNPWVSFCMSTYRRPEMLLNALQVISNQTYKDYDVIVSDNDPEAGAGEVVLSMKDSRFKYFHNGDNLGMIKSFNKSIERATGEYVVMITDDDPVVDTFLEEIHAVYLNKTGLSLYGGFRRSKSVNGQVELIKPEQFILEILDPEKTTSILWSSCIMKRSDVIEVGMMPEEGSPHLADHALLAMVGRLGGGIMINRMFSSITSHENNFSKFNFDYYVSGCLGFFKVMDANCKSHENYKEEKKIIIKHIGSWFITNIFNLKKYYTINYNSEVLSKIDDCANQILAFEFMTEYRTKFKIKNAIFLIKKNLNLLKR